ncbi:MAG: hypothetical protein ISP49_09835 [Reyranella sp.]|jgi:hypothetical protein|nr:hypothetical protein [Reyranella sp.]MBL6651881.1 hypothetical protein [Reyranella sp.]
MRVFLALWSLFLLTACEGSFVRPSSLGRKVGIERSYEARDACLSRNAAAESTSTTDFATAAQAVALACQPETDKLIVASDQTGDAKIAASIRKDTEFRAMKYVLQARGQALF